MQNILRNLIQKVLLYIATKTRIVSKRIHFTLNKENFAVYIKKA